jgi:3-oxoacyl-[acyl-carrier-protein] synthase-3
MAALELTAGYLSGTRQRAAVIATADRYSLPGYDRWRGHCDTPLGDGAAALVLSRERGFAKVRAASSWSEPELEGASRGNDPFGVAPLSLGRPVDMTTRRAAFIARLGADNWSRLATNACRSVVAQTLGEAALRLDQIDWFVLPHVGGHRLATEYAKPLGIDLARATWEPWGRHVGHLGSADQFAGLEFLLSSGRLRPGQYCLMIGTGGDFTWSCVVLEMREEPSWVPDPAGTASTGAPTPPQVGPRQ